MIFGDLRFKADDQSSWEGNFGLGYRRMLGDGWNIGSYGFFDHRHSSNGNYFDQFTLGVELLGTNFDLRANSYWPVGNVQQQVAGSQFTPLSSAVIQGNALLVTSPGLMASMEYALRGFDVEAGVRVPVTPVTSPLQFRVYAGGFRFDEASGTAPIVSGPRLRLEFTAYQIPELWGGTRLTGGVEW